MKNIGKTAALTSLFALTTTLAHADPFIKPPETFAPSWSTTFPYERNVNMGFTITPVTTPGSGIPAATYEGITDSFSKSTDYALFSGDVTWYSSVPGISQTGLIGIDNRTGSTTLTGTATFSLGSLFAGSGAQNVWGEVMFLSNGGEFSEADYDNFGNQATVLGGAGLSFSGGDLVSDIEWQNTPSPSSSSLVETFSVPAGSYVLVDDLHLATESVPEPTSLSYSLAAVSFLGLGLGMKKLRNRTRNA